MMDLYSPPLSVTSEPDLDDMTDEELDNYFATYVPLSNLPTPPPTKDMAPSKSTMAEARQAPELEVYATHLSKLVPNNVSPIRPSTASIRSFLDRANLPPEIVAFAACILDALSQRFATSWRAACCLPPSPGLSFQLRQQQPSIGAEVIVLSALSLAHGFLSDRDRSTRHWAQFEGESQFSVREIEMTRWCILQDLDYGLQRIPESMVKRMLKDMQHAGNFSTSRAFAVPEKKAPMVEREEKRPKLNVEPHGIAVWQNGVHTPEPSP